MILNGKIFNPGELRTEITLQSRIVTTGSGGFMTITSGSSGACTYVTVFAKWTNIHGKEVWVSQSVNAIQPATVLLRYISGMDTTWQIVKDGQVYDIVSINDIQNRHEYIELKVQHVRAG